MQRPLHYAIVDEVDSILINEARTPRSAGIPPFGRAKTSPGLTISGPAEQSADLYMRVDQVIPRLRKDSDYTVDEKSHSAMLTASGIFGQPVRDPTTLRGGALPIVQ